MSENLYDRIDAMRKRVDALFPEKDRGYGDDMRLLLLLAEDRCARLASPSILSVLNELVGRMEADVREAAALDEYVTRMEADALLLLLLHSRPGSPRLGTGPSHAVAMR